MLKNTRHFAFFLLKKLKNFAFFVKIFNMKRKIYENLINWKNDIYKKPLIIEGARQIGKTYIVNEFAHYEYSNCIYINFEMDENLDSIFESLNPNVILENIKSIKKVNIIPNETLIIFDEIQKSEKAINSLKYFCEFKTRVDIIAMGSLLGIAVNRKEFSFPVGKVNIMKMYQLDFEEYLIAINEIEKLKIIKEHYENDKPINEMMHKQLIDLYKTYLFLGGMPEVVKTYIETKNLQIARIKQNEIVNTYLMDMTKYNSKTNYSKTVMVYNSIPTNLARENKKFMYSNIKKSARAKDYENATEWISLAGIGKKINKLNQIKVPLSAYKDNEIFKFYMNDVGLLGAKANIMYEEIISEEENFADFKGGLAENYVMSQLMIKNDEIYYYRDDKNIEIDFIIKLNDNIIPIEVKSGKRTKSICLNNYVKMFNPNYSIKISTKNFGFDNGIKSIPLYAVWCI